MQGRDTVFTASRHYISPCLVFTRGIQCIILTYNLIYANVLRDTIVFHHFLYADRTYGFVLHSIVDCNVEATKDFSVTELQKLYITLLLFVRGKLNHNLCHMRRRRPCAIQGITRFLVHDDKQPANL